MRLPLILLVLSFNPLQAGPSAGAEMLAKACRAGDVKTAETLLSSSADPNLLDGEGRTPLYYAALFNRNDVAALLLAHDADPNTRTRAGSAEPLGEFPQTPLQIAASMGNLGLASMLITAGARVDTKAEAGRTALHFAVLGSHLDVIRLLIEKGAEVNTRDGEGASPLDDAVWRGYLDGTAILLARGSHLNEPETRTGATPINEAAYKGKTQLVQYLLQFHPDLGIGDRGGHIPLENAVRMGNADSALLLLEAMPHKQTTPELLSRVLNSAVKRDQAVVVKALLRRGADANYAFGSGATPLDLAAAAGASEVVRVLLSVGADPNREGQNGTTPLEDASLKGFGAIVGMLLDHGAQVNHVNATSGTTALYAAASFGKSDVLRLLLKRGADPNACGRGRVSPYDAAVENGYAEIATEIQHSGGSKSCKPQHIE